jgi:hypothetical protein
MTNAKGIVSRLWAAAACAAIIGAAGPAHAQDQACRHMSIEQILDKVPEGATWQSLDLSLRVALEKRAQAVLARDRVAWGPAGLEQKLDILVSAPTDLANANVDRVLADTFASELKEKFQMARDVQNPELRRQLLRVYLAIVDWRGYNLLNHPDYRDWDGRPLRELYIVDHEHYRTMAEWNVRTEAGLRKIPADALTELERTLRDKAYFTTRAGKHFDRPNLGLSGSPAYASQYELYPLRSDTDLLDAYNTMLLTAFRDINVGTMDAFDFDFDGEFSAGWLKSQSIPDDVAKGILKIGTLYRSKVRDLPGVDARCTIFSEAERTAYWDNFTAVLISNADGSETMQSYARLYEGVALGQRKHMQEIAVEMLGRLFPDGSKLLTAEQRDKVAARLGAETRPAAMIDTLIATLDEVTGATDASKFVTDALDNQPSVGGGYASGEPVREADRKNILDMWNKARAFIAREYGGYRVDIAALVPEEPVIVPTGDIQFAIGGQVNLSLGSKLNLASLSSTILHEMKHAVDQNSHAPIEGAAWEGGASTVERQVWPQFIEEAMAGQGDFLPMAILKTEVDNVRLTATTDATLKVFLRESCNADEPDSIEFAKAIVASYGYTDDNILQLRSRRAHRGTQYLEYDYGQQMYLATLDHLQKAVGPEPRVDAYLLQACAIANPKQDQATSDDLKACIQARKQ